jgi:hypothetical protein
VRLQDVRRQLLKDAILVRLRAKGDQNIDLLADCLSSLEVVDEEEVVMLHEKVRIGLGKLVYLI